jgi:ABC-type multidrug transport system fused ATPase/permease subunit
MSDIAIRVEGLGKQYLLGEGQESYTLLSDRLMNAMKSPLKLLSRLNGQARKEQDILWALKDISFTVRQGDVIGIIGRNGAGKSTLLSLVPRFYDPTAGRLTLDGRDIREITKKSLRQQIAIVLQDTLLFSTTVRENIAYGRPDATDEEIREAARRAQADEFISQLPNGYESEVGERGGHLSVGQRQRIGIARAFLKNAPILLLDEPTSALDPTTESAIMETIKDLMHGRTTIIITHRIATIHNVDQIVVLEGGRVVEQGRGPELVARGGVYAKLHASGKFNT